MEEKFFYGAPWGAVLKIMTAFSVIILGGVSMIGFFSGPEKNPEWIIFMIFMVAVPLTSLVIAPFFAIRGFVLSRDALLIQRPAWDSKVSLADLVAVEADPDAMTKSIRTFGNGGMFCIAGTFKNSRLGKYRAFATDPKLSVVLRFSDHIVVITPDDPLSFVAKVKDLKGSHFVIQLNQAHYF